jgi:acyl-coenzyme A thioesterase PaaI-like protein
MTSENSSRALRDAAGVEPLGPGHFSVNLSEFYTVVGHPNGGYLQSVLGNAALAAASAEGSQHLHVTAITTNYIGSPNCGPAELHTQVRKVGRGVSFVHVALHQDGHITTESLVTLGTLHEEAHVRYTDTQVPTLAPLEECRQSTGGDEINIMSVVDQRLDPACTTWVDGVISDRGEVRAWLRLNDGAQNWDPWSLLFASDAMPPATFPLGSSGWVPTLQLSTYVRRVPQGEWLRVRQWCVTIADNLVDERCELFDETGELVSSASQLAMVRFPSHG